MDYKLIYFFIEGYYDRLFFKNIIEPILKEYGYLVELVEYSRKKSQETMRFINSIERMAFADYLFISDLDKVKNVNTKIKQLVNTYDNLDENKVVIVIKEIESWYLAGLSSDVSEKIRIKSYPNTEKIGKDKFYSIIRHLKNDNKIECYMDILDLYSLDIAKQKNNSFRFFIENFIDKIIQKDAAYTVE